MGKLLDFSAEELLAELERRSTPVDDTKLIVGTICWDSGEQIVEMFKAINSEDDLKILSSVSLRARFNSHRQYKLFYTKSSDFKKLKTFSDADPVKFAEWVISQKHIKFENI